MRATNFIKLITLSLQLICSQSFAISNLQLHATAGGLTCTNDQTSVANNFFGNLLVQINAFGKIDSRKAILPFGENYIYAPIGKLVSTKVLTLGNKQGIAQSTVFYVFPCRILTNRHSVFGGAEAIFSPEEASKNGYDMKFTVGQDRDGNAKFKDIRATPVMWWGPSIEDGNDWALLRSHPCAGGDDAIGWVTLGTPKLNQSVTMARFPGDRPLSKLWLGGKCQIRGVGYDYEMYHECDARPGTSGSPLIYRADNGSPVVVAMNAGDVRPTDKLIARWSPYTTNTSVSMERVRATIDKEIQKTLAWFDRATNGQKNPQVVMAQQLRGT